MKEVVLTDAQLMELEDIYYKLQEQYERVAGVLDFSCDGCPDNCCDSYFLHHTYAEWAHLWLGVKELAPKRQEVLLARARSYVEQCHRDLAAGRRPQIMCPLNEDGLCVLYQHRLLVCRTHGVPASMTRPDGQTLRFPGCFRCQDIFAAGDEKARVPHVERTGLLQRLARLENQLMGNRRHLLPKVKKSIAEMLVLGPPVVPRSFCEKKGDGAGGDNEKSG